MIDIVQSDFILSAHRYKFHLDTESDQLEVAGIQDQIIAIVWGWA